MNAFWFPSVSKKLDCVQRERERQRKKRDYSISLDEILCGCTRKLCIPYPFE